MYGKPLYSFKQKDNSVQLTSGKDSWLLGKEVRGRPGYMMETNGEAIARSGQEMVT